MPSIRYIQGLLGTTHPNDNDKKVQFQTAFFTADEEVPHEWRLRKYKVGQPVEWISTNTYNTGSFTGGKVAEIQKQIGSIIDDPFKNAGFEVDGEYLINNSDIQLKYGYQCERSIPLDDVINLVFKTDNNRISQTEYGYDYETKRWPSLPEFLRPDFELLLKYPEIRNTMYKDIVTTFVLGPKSKTKGVERLLHYLEPYTWTGNQRTCQLVSFNPPTIE